MYMYCVDRSIAKIFELTRVLHGATVSGFVFKGGVSNTVVTGGFASFAFSFVKCVVKPEEMTSMW